MDITTILKNSAYQFKEGGYVIILPAETSKEQKVAFELALYDLYAQWHAGEELSVVQRLTPESESKGQPEAMEPQVMHVEAKHLKEQVQGYVDAFMELGLGSTKALEISLNYCGVKCSFDSFDL